MKCNVNIAPDSGLDAQSYEILPLKSAAEARFRKKNSIKTAPFARIQNFFRIFVGLNHVYARDYRAKQDTSIMHNQKQTSLHSR